MYRPFLLFFALCIFSTATLGQSASADSQTLQALLSEIRQLRKDLQTTAVAAQRVQILMYRLQMQQALVTRAQQRVDEVRSKLAQSREGVRHFASEVEQMETVLHETESSANRKELESMLPARKGQLESEKTAVQEWETKEAEAVQNLRSEESKLAALEDLLDRLDRELEKSSR